MNRIFLDMDGVVVDFDRYMRSMGLTSDEVKRKPGAYLEMPPIPGAFAGVQWLIGRGFDVWLATKPPTGISYAYSDKAEWVFRNLPELKRKLILTHDKGLLGDGGDFLVDDRPHKANCEQFRGMLITFTSWEETLRIMKALSFGRVYGTSTKDLKKLIGDEKTMRALVIDDAAKLKVKRLVEYAQDRRNWYIIEFGGCSKQPPPGSNRYHVIQLDSYRCVFSYSKQLRDQRVFCHLSISIPREDYYANPITAFTIAELFGFTGWDAKSTTPPHNWFIDVNHRDQCIVLVQEIQP